MSVYFVTCREANAVKIGSSVEPHARLSEIQWGCPLVLKLEAVLPGGFEEEHRYHAWFDDARLRGEWFTITPAIEQIIASNPAPEMPPDHVRTANAQAKRLNHNVSELRYTRAVAAKRVEETMPKRPKYAFDSRQLSKSQRQRINDGDIYFPFRAKESA